MKYWVLLVSLFILGCGSDEQAKSDAVDDSIESAGKAAADALIGAQDAAKAVGDVLQEKKDEVDEALEEAEDATND